MRPLIIEYAESPTANNVDISLIQYSDTLNLNVRADNLQPAIDSLLTETCTTTRSTVESSDSDSRSDSTIADLMSTETRTFVRREDSDSDQNLSLIRSLMQTQTITESVEPTDSDK